MPVTQCPGLVVYQDTIYDIREGGSVYHFLGNGMGWKALAGNADMFQWAIGDSIYHFLNAKFLYRYIMTDKPQELSHNVESKGIAASSRFVYQIEPKNGRVYQFNGMFWNIIDSNRNAVAIAVDVDDTKLYQLHGDDAISQYLGSLGWQEIDSTPGVRTIVAEGGKLFKIHKDGSLYVYKAAYIWDRLDDNSSDTVQVSAGAAGVYQRRGDGSVWLYSDSGQKWDRIFDGNGQVMAITVGKQVYARKKDKSVIFFDGNEWHALIHQQQA